MTKIVIAFVIILIVIYARIWLINSVFVDKKIKINLTWKIFLMGLFMVTSLFIYKYFLGYLWLENIYFANILSIKSIWLFIIYCLFFVILNSLIYKNITIKKIWQAIVLWIVLFIWIWYGWYIIWITTVLMYYFLAAYAEEIIKFIAGENIYEKEWKNNSDLIFFCILVWLAFAIVENIFYLWWNIFNPEVNLIWLSIWRWLVSSMLHVITTGIIAFFVMKWLNKNNKNPDNKLGLWYILFVFAGIVVWFGIHSIYNLSLFYDWKFISIPIIVLWYFVFSFLMFKSDKIYIRYTNSAN
jgi:hypothetical protein